MYRSPFTDHSGECAENIAVPGLVGADEVFRVPLHSDAPPRRICGRFYALDHSVWRDCNHAKLVCDALDRLMVHGIDFQARQPDCARESRFGLNFDGMRARGAWPIGIVVDVARMLAWNVLDQRAAERHVEQLRAPANGEQRSSTSFRGVDQRDLPVISNVGHGAEHGMPGRVVQCRIEVGATGEHQGVYVLHEIFRSSWVVQWGGNEWYEPCVLQGREVGRSQVRKRYVALAADCGANRYNRTE